MSHTKTRPLSISKTETLISEVESGFDHHNKLTISLKGDQYIFHLSGVCLFSKQSEYPFTLHEVEKTASTCNNEKVAEQMLELQKQRAEVICSWMGVPPNIM